MDVHVLFSVWSLKIFNFSSIRGGISILVAEETGNWVKSKLKRGARSSSSGL